MFQPELVQALLAQAQQNKLSGLLSPSAQPSLNLSALAGSASGVLAGLGQPQSAGGLPTPSGVRASSSGPLISVLFLVPNANGVVGSILGRGGAHIKQLQASSNTKFWMEDGPRGATNFRIACVTGTLPDCTRCVGGILERMELASSYDPNGGGDKLELLVPSHLQMRMIGPKGSTVKSFRAESGAHIHIHTDNEDSPQLSIDARQVTVAGTVTARLQGLVAIWSFILKQSDIPEEWLGGNLRKMVSTGARATMRYSAQPEPSPANSEQHRKRPRIGDYAAPAPALQPNMLTVGSLDLPQTLLDLPPTNIVNVVYYSGERPHICEVPAWLVQGHGRPAASQAPESAEGAPELEVDRTGDEQATAEVEFDNGEEPGVLPVAEEVGATAAPEEENEEDTSGLAPAM